MACWQQAKMLYKYKGSRHTRTHTHTPPDELNQSSGTAELRFAKLLVGDTYGCAGQSHKFLATNSKVVGGNGCRNWQT